MLWSHKLLKNQVCSLISGLCVATVEGTGSDIEVKTDYTFPMWSDLTSYIQTIWCNQMLLQVFLRFCIWIYLNF